MKTASTNLKAHFGQDCMTLAMLWKVTRLDGVEMGFTTHDVDLVYDGTTYYAATGFVPSATESKSDMSVDNLEVTGFLDSSAIDAADVRAGFYDNAEVVQRVVNWADLSMGDMIIRKGTTGNLKMFNGLFVAEVRGISQKLTTELGQTYGPICRAELGSGLPMVSGNFTNPTRSRWLCRIDLDLYRQSGSVSTSAEPRTLVPVAGLNTMPLASPAVAAPSGWFDDGILEFTSGVLDGRVFEIKSWDGTTLTMFVGFPLQPSPGDSFTIEPGCNHTLADCRDKFDNVINRRAEDFIPGEDVVLNYPDSKTL